MSLPLNSRCFLRTGTVTSIYNVMIRIRRFNMVHHYYIIYRTFFKFYQEFFFFLFSGSGSNSRLHIALHDQYMPGTVPQQGFDLSYFDVFEKHRLVILCQVPQFGFVRCSLMIRLRWYIIGRMSTEMRLHSPQHIASEGSPSLAMLALITQLGGVHKISPLWDWIFNQ